MLWRYFLWGFFFHFFFWECLSFQVTLILGLFFLPFGQSISEFLPRSYYVKPVVLKSWIPIPGIMTSNPKIECIVVSEGKQERKETLGTNREGWSQATVTDSSESCSSVRHLDWQLMNLIWMVGKIAFQVRSTLIN